MNDQRLLAAWGLTVTAGWLVTAGFGAVGTALFGLGVAGTIIAAWAALMAVPLAMTFTGRRADLHSGAWAALVAGGMIENAVAAGVGGKHDHAAHGHGGGEAAGAEQSEHAGTGHAHDEPASDAPSEPMPQASEPQEDAHADHPHPDGAAHDHGAPETPPADTAVSTHATTDHHAAASPDSGTGHGASGHHDAAESHEMGGAHDAGTDGGLITPEVQHVSYHHLWFAIGAVGFAVSAWQAEGGARKTLYGVAAALNALMVVLLVIYPPVEALAFLVAAGIQGLPMLADLPLRRRAHAAVA